MKRQLLSLLLAILCGACTTTKPDSATDTLAVDSSASNVVADEISEPPVRSYLLHDTALASLSSRPLKAKEVKRLFYPAKESGRELTSYLVNYFHIDSINRKLVNNDLRDGAVTSVRISFIDTLFANTDYTLCTWKIDYKTGESCPYASGTLFAISSFTPDGVLVSSAAVAERASGADAPMTWENKRNSVLYIDGVLEVYYRESKRDEEGKPEATVYSRQQGTISETGVIKLEPKKEITKQTYLKKARKK